MIDIDVKYQEEANIIYLHPVSTLYDAVIIGSGTTDPSGSPEKKNLVYTGVRAAQSLPFYVVLCISVFYFFPVYFWPLNCLSFSIYASDYLFGIFNLLFEKPKVNQECTIQSHETPATTHKMETKKITLKLKR